MESRIFNYQQHLRKNSFYPNFLPILDGLIIAGIIVFLTSNFLFFHGEKVTLPNSNLSSHYSQATEVLSVTRDGQFFFRNKKMNYEEFYSYFQNIHQDTPLRGKHVLLVKIDAGQNIQTFIKIKKLAELVGYQDILIATENAE